MYQVIRKIWIRIFSFFYKYELLLYGVKIEGSPIFLGRIQIRGNPKRLKIGNNVKVQRNTCFNIIKRNDQYGEIIIGENSLIGDNTIISASKSIKVYRNVEIAANSYLIDHDHDSLFTTSNPSSILIENNVWIGCGVTILKGVRIRERSVIGAGSIISRDILNTSLVVGNPQKTIKTKE